LSKMRFIAYIYHARDTTYPDLVYLPN
jgi:hypothetical protein